MQKVVFENNRGSSITFSNQPPFVLSSIEGLGDLEASIQDQKAPYQDGSTFIDSSMETRPIPIEFSILANNYSEISKYRNKVSSIFNPKLGEGLLTYENNSGKWEIKCVSESSPFFPSGDNRGPTYQVGSLNLIAHHPYWREKIIKSSQMSFVMGGFSFPLRLGTQFSQRSFRRIFKNDGDVETPVHIEFRGPAINPVIKNNTTGEFIQVNRTLSETDKLIIDTTFGQKSVEIEDAEGNRTDAFNWINPQSWFFQLQIGENQLEYNSNNDSTKTRVVISYRNMYVGV
ncbi:phage tail family protein [Virgibacillus sp. M23]|uniref:phage tail family protein n=1 Tax=Virgibacillus sp. M23 TaxID=3079030 RepID=UPI002A90A8E5|nr:phage tail family protein [Virgibacillus sp. M23]MDY7044434.1 phage tail family protein [Virgibacillus sp. M23]